MFEQNIIIRLFMLKYQNTNLCRMCAYNIYLYNYENLETMIQQFYHIHISLQSI